ALTTRQRTIHLPGPGGTVREVVSVMDVVGATMLLPRKAIERIGLFDENFFLYGNDTELCYRARHHGYEVIVAPDVKVHHRHAGQCAMEPWSRRAIFSQRAMMIRSVKIRNRSLAYGISDCLRSLWNDMRDAINRRSARALRAQLRNALWLCRKLPSIINSRFRDYPLHRTKERTA
ncbi:MAG TPA: glycosyltransferase family 2 protein, partial [Candidatus Brocadiia bacterium]|nr:glycosyltransferase family 2 protein [Candidatus Brocadiia bacterium]